MGYAYHNMYGHRLYSLYWKINRKHAIRIKYDREFRYWQGMTDKRLAELRDVYFGLYCCYLGVDKNSFKGRTVVDIGCGPHGALGVFDASLKIGVDPLAGRYKKRFGLTGHDMTYLNCPAENISLADGVADVVISRNSLDHVDDFSASISEIYRILKGGGQIIFAINIQPYPTLSEPLLLNERIIQREFESKFEYEITERFPPNDVTRRGEFAAVGYPHEIIIVKGYKIKDKKPRETGVRKPGSGVQMPDSC